jgi:succinate dehydrogenase / fumarate reductase cytochrome b subunit
VNKQRPKNLNLLTIKFPITAIVSILHRISGMILFLLIPLMLWGLEYSLGSQENFEYLRSTLAQPIPKVILWLCLAAFLYHFTAGIRHLLMDYDVGIQLKSSRLMSVLTLVIVFILITLAGVYLW